MPKKQTERIIEFSKVAYYKLSVLLSSIDTEFGFHGTVSHPSKELYRVEDIFLYPQEVSSATADADEERYAVWLSELDDETFNMMKLQGHSHADMMCHPSQTDRDLYNQIAGQIKDGYYLFIIVNRTQRVWCEIREGKEIITDDQIRLRVDDDMVVELFDSMDEMIREKKYTYSTHFDIDEYIKKGGAYYDRPNEE